MKELAIGALALVVSLFAGSAISAQTISAAPKGPAVVDLSKPLPATIDVTVGQSIHLENGTAKAEGKETDGKGKLFRQELRTPAKLTASFRTLRVGSGEISIEQGGKTETIAVNVMYPPRPARPPGTGPLPRPKAAVVVDLSKALPAKIQVTTRQKVVFMNVTGKVEGADTDGKGKILNDIAQKNGLSVFEATREGKGEFTITTPGTTPKVEKLTFEVIAPPPAQPAPQPKASPARLMSTVTVDLSKPLPKKLTVYQGQSLVFEKGTNKVEAKETDGKGNLFQSRPHNTFNQAAAFSTLRLGKGAVTVTFPSQGMLTVIRQETIEIEVLPIPPNVRTAPPQKP